jgi:hypothetical protein
VAPATNTKKTSKPDPKASTGRCGVRLRSNDEPYKVRPLPADFGGGRHSGSRRPLALSTTSAEASTASNAHAVISSGVGMETTRRVASTSGALGNP